MDDECACGHVEDEHEFLNGHYAECAIEGCPCIHYEEGEGIGWA